MLYSATTTLLADDFLAVGKSRQQARHGAEPYRPRSRSQRQARPVRGRAGLVIMQLTILVAVMVRREAERMDESQSLSSVHTHVHAGSSAGCPLCTYLSARANHCRQGPEPSPHAGSEGCTPDPLNPNLCCQPSQQQQVSPSLPVPTLALILFESLAILPLITRRKQLKQKCHCLLSRDWGLLRLNGNWKCLEPVGGPEGWEGRSPLIEKVATYGKAINCHGGCSIPPSRSAGTGRGVLRSTGGGEIGFSLQGLQWLLKI